MAISRPRAIPPFLNSGLAVGLRSVVALGAFVVIVRDVSDPNLAIYGIAFFVWNLIFITAQNIGAQPLMDQPRLRTVDVVSADP